MTRRRRWKRALLWLAILGPIGLVVFLALSVVLLPLILTDEYVKREAVSALTEQLDVPVSIDRLTYHPLTGVEIFGLVIGPPKGFKRDVARIERVALLYDLSGLTSLSVTVHEVAIEKPQLVVEAKLSDQGVPFTNLDVIVQKLAGPKKDPPPPEETPKPPGEKPLSPIDLVLEKLVVDSLSIERVGPVPNFSLTGLSIRSDAKIDQQDLHAALTLSITPPGAGETNLTFDDPAKSLSAKMRFALTASTTVDAAASAGFDLGDVIFGLTGELDGEATIQGNTLPPIDVDIIAGLGVRPKEDRITFAPLRLFFSKATIVDLSASVIGLEGAFAELLGPVAAENLAAQLGLVRQRPDDVATLLINTLALPLDVLAPYMSVFAPGLSASGVIALTPLEITGTVLEVIRGNPRGLKMRLAFDKVALAYPDAGVSIRELGGGINLARSDDGQYFGMEGSLALAGVAQQNNKAERAFLSVRAKVERLAYPPPGETEVELVLSAEGVRAPPATVNRATINVALKGRDVLFHDRTDLEPVEANVAVKADLVRAQTGTAAHELRNLDLAVRSLADRLLLPAKQPIDAQIDLQLGSASVAGGNITAKGVVLGVETKISDPRTGDPIDADTKIALNAKELRTPDASVAGAQINVQARTNGIARRALPVLPAPTWLPAFTEVDLDVALPEVVARDIPASVAFKTNFTADLTQGAVAMRSLTLELWKEVHLRISGKFAQLYAKDRFVDAKVELLPIDLGRLANRVPKAWLDQVMPGLQTAGKLGLSVRAKGQIPAQLAKIDLGAPPVEAHVVLSSEDVALLLPSRKLDIKGFGGKITLDVTRGKSELTTDLVAAKLAFLSEKGGEQALEEMTLRTRAGFRGQMFELTTDLDARGKDRASFDIDLTYVKHGDVQLRRLDINLPGTGLELDVTGRLVRRTFGVLRPELALKVKVDLDKFGELYPGAAEMHGVVGVNVDITTPNDRRAIVAGVLELAGFGYEQGKLIVKNATGRIPIEQRLALPPPIMRELVAGAEGVLGDDLERRLEELQDDFYDAKLIVDQDDILLEAPRSADYQPLRPYYAEKGARLSIASIQAGRETLKNVVLDGLYRSGVLRADRFAAQVWEGDILGDLALQVSSDLNIRVRQRGTITNLNLDIPYSQVKEIAPVKDAKKKEEYEVAGTTDLRFLLHERLVTMKLDLTKLRKPTLERLLGYLDPAGKNPGIERARWALSVSEAVGLRPVAGQFTIAQNLVSMNVEWSREWLPEWLGDWTSVFTLLRVASIPIVGSIIVGNVNGALGDKTSIGPFIVPVIAGLGLEEKLQLYLGGRVVAEDLSSAVAREP